MQRAGKRTLTLTTTTCQKRTRLHPRCAEHTPFIALSSESELSSAPIFVQRCGLLREAAPPPKKERSNNIANLIL